MEFDKWFKSQSKLVRVLLLVIPVVSWVVEILVRLSATLRKPTATNIVGLIIFGFVNFVVAPSIIDAIYLALTDNQLLIE